MMLWKNLILIFFILVIFSGIIVPLGFLDAQAADCSKNLQLNWPPSPLGTDLTTNCDLTHLIQYLYEWLIGLGGLAVFVVLVYSGFDYLTSAGDSRKMKDALARIRNAFLGLALLLGSYLILNTINPQLTTLKLSKIPPEQKSWQIDPFFGEKTSVCQSADLYAEAGHKGEPFKTLVNEAGKNTADGITQETRSVKLWGTEGLKDTGCQLFLYKNPGFEAGNPDDPPLIILAEVKNMEVWGGGTFFGSAKLISSGSPPCEKPACLYENNLFSGKTYEVETTQSLAGIDKIHDEVSSVRVGAGSAIVLFKDSEMKDGALTPPVENKCLTVRGGESVRDLAEKPYNERLPNDSASAVALLELAESQTIPQGAIILCDDRNCNKGWKQSITSDISNLENLGINDSASQIQIALGYAAVLFISADYIAGEEGGIGKPHGCVLITKAGSYHLADDLNFLNDELSSIQVMKIKRVIGEFGH